MTITPYYQDEHVTLHLGDALAVLSGLDSGSVDCCVTSPPYFGLRSYQDRVECDRCRALRDGEGRRYDGERNIREAWPDYDRHVREEHRVGEVEGQYGLEASPAEYVETMRAVFAEVRRVLADDGVMWLNLGDSYSGGDRVTYNTTGGKEATCGLARQRPRTGVPGKNLLGIPWRVAFALQDDGWILRNDIIWAKPNGMPESVTDRLSTKHEHVFMFSKSPRYWFDLDAVREPSDPANYRAPQADVKYIPVLNPGRTSMLYKGKDYSAGPGRNPGDVWSIPTQPFSSAHFAVMPQALAERCILAGCKPAGAVLDPFSGSGTTGLAATKHGRRYVGIDLSAEYLDLSLRTRLVQATLDFGEAL